jgi:hypothetical protein
MPANAVLQHRSSLMLVFWSLEHIWRLNAFFMHNAFSIMVLISFNKWCTLSTFRPSTLGFPDFVMT